MIAQGLYSLLVYQGWAARLIIQVCCLNGRLVLSCAKLHVPCVQMAVRSVLAREMVAFRSSTWCKRLWMSTGQSVLLYLSAALSKQCYPCRRAKELLCAGMGSSSQLCLAEPLLRQSSSSCCISFYKLSRNCIDKLLGVFLSVEWVLCSLRMCLGVFPSVEWVLCSFTHLLGCGKCGKRSCCSGRGLA